MLSVKSKTSRAINPWNGEPLPKLEMSEEEFVEWCDDKTRAEWVDGKVVIMSPSSVEQDELNRWIASIVSEFLAHHDLGRVMGPNVTARFATQRRRRVPDVLVVLKNRLNLVMKNHIEGAPDLIMEIVAPESQTRDRREKFFEYEKAGVREYWIIDQAAEQVEVYALKRGKYTEVAQEKDIWRSVLLAGFYLRAPWLWRKPLPRYAPVLKELGILQ
jgi:Uma2 family endonuclease